MILLIISPQVYMQSCLKGLLIWTNSVLPALFPFFVFSSILLRLGVVDKIGMALNKTMRKIFHTSGESGLIYILSIISGYPVGAKITSEMYQANILSKEEVVRINAFASTSGPLFIIGAVGVGMFVSHTGGVIMMISHILGALCNGLVYRNYKYTTVVSCLRVKNFRTSEILSKTMYDSIISILIVGGYIVIFNIIIDMLFNIGVLQFFANLLSEGLSFLGLPQDVAEGIVGGVLEVTRGCNELAEANASLKILLPMACGLISWGGFSIHLQAFTFLSKCNINFGFYLLQKLTQSLISAGICGLICYFAI